MRASPSPTPRSVAQYVLLRSNSPFNKPSEILHRPRNVELSQLWKIGQVPCSRTKGLTQLDRLAIQSPSPETSRCVHRRRRSRWPRVDLALQAKCLTAIAGRVTRRQRPTLCTRARVSASTQVRIDDPVSDPMTTELVGLAVALYLPAPRGRACSRG